jgi:SOS-response transcriptional repressor LexA
MPPTFTARQGEYLAFIHRYTLKHGVAPSFEEISIHFGTTAPSVNAMVKTLERNGLLSRVPGAARTLRVLVPASLLPQGGFGSRAHRAPTSEVEGAPAASLAETAAEVAIAVLDSLMRKLPPGVETATAALEAAVAVQTWLVRAGASQIEAEEAARQVAAEGARWQPDGRGLVVRRRRWIRR